MRKLAIVGLSRGSINAPFNDKSFEIWTLNRGCRLYKKKRIDKYFDLHDWEESNYLPDYLSFINETKYEFINTENYPLEGIIEQYGCFLKNSIPMILAYAGYKDYRDIYLWGCDKEEYEDNIEMGFSLYYILGQLRKEKRNVYLVNQFNLDDSEIYGFMNMERTRIPKGFYFK